MNLLQATDCRERREGNARSIAQPTRVFTYKLPVLETHCASNDSRGDRDVLFACVEGRPLYSWSLSRLRTLGLLFGERGFD